MPAFFVVIGTEFVAILFFFQEMVDDGQYVMGHSNSGSIGPTSCGNAMIHAGQISVFGSGCGASRFDKRTSQLFVPFGRLSGLSFPGTFVISWS